MATGQHRKPAPLFLKGMACFLAAALCFIFPASGFARENPNRMADLQRREAELELKLLVNQIENQSNPDERVKLNREILQQVSSVAQDLVATKELFDVRQEFFQNPAELMADAKMDARLDSLLNPGWNMKEQAPAIVRMIERQSSQMEKAVEVASVAEVSQVLQAVAAAEPLPLAEGAVIGRPEKFMQDFVKGAAANSFEAITGRPGRLGEVEIRGIEIAAEKIGAVDIGKGADVGVEIGAEIIRGGGVGMNRGEVGGVGEVGLEPGGDLNPGGGPPVDVGGGPGGGSPPVEVGGGGPPDEGKGQGPPEERGKP